jgi:uncharacterized protein (DUF697 family)
MLYLERRRSRRIIHTAAIAGALAALVMAQLPASDNLILVIEVLMVIRLGSVFRVDLKRSVSTSFIVGNIATLVGRGISEFLVGWIPVAGNIIDALTAAAVIEFFGHTVARSFERGLH